MPQIRNAQKSLQTFWDLNKVQISFAFKIFCNLKKMKCNFVEFLQELIYLATAEENLHPTKSFQKQNKQCFMAECFLKYTIKLESNVRC
jgi:hypothetical protein